MSEDLHRIHDMLAALFMALSPATFMAVVVVMLGLGVWVTRKGWHSRRVARAVANAPLVDLRSSAGGLVKIRGTAQPTAANPGGGPSSLIWYSRTRRTGSNSSTLATTDNSLIRDDHDVCAVNTDKTTILPSASVAKDGFLDQHTSSVEKALYSGDAVFALGELRRELPALAGVSDAGCQLASCGGVLLVSGGTEREARVLYSLRFAVQAPLALLCFGLLGFGTWAHVVGYLRQAATDCTPAGLRCADATKSKDDPTPTFGRPIRLAGSGRHPQGGFQGAAR